MNEFKSWNGYRRFANQVRRKTRFIRTPEDEDFLRGVLQTSKSRLRELPAGTGLWRAQLGHGWRPICQGDVYVGNVPTAFPRERMRPLPGRAREGRANPKGIPVLYLSTHQETAMSEVRPWLGSLVSCAHFKTVRRLKIVDFSVYHGRDVVFHFEEPDEAEREEAVWSQIDRAFSEPTTVADDTADYAPTQVIAEMFRNDGYDGIAYKSAFGDDGYNIALFDPEDAELTYCALFEVKSLEFQFMETDNPYWVIEDGSTKTLSVEEVGPLSQPEENGS